MATTSIEGRLEAAGDSSKCSEPAVDSHHRVRSAMPLGGRCADQRGIAVTRGPATGKTPSPTVLYVEDSPTNQELMRHAIQKRPGVKLVIAGRGAEAVELALAERPVLVLLDRHLPDMTGEEVLRLLRSRNETADIPVVVVSADTSVSRPGEDALGVIGYLPKPIDILALLSYVDKACAAQT